MATLQTLIAGHLFAWLLVFTRVGSAFMVMPLFGDQFVPVRVRLLLALVISVIVTPALEDRVPPEPVSLMALFLLLGSEVMIGVFIGSLPRLMFSALEVAGMIIAMQTGLSNAFVFNPALASQGSLPGSMLSWLALLLIRIAENQTNQTWRNLRDELQRMHLGTFTGPAGTFRQRTELTKNQRDILAQLNLDPPPRIYQLTPPAS